MSRYSLVFLAVTAFLTVSPAALQSQHKESNRWTPELQLQYRTIPATAISADGALVAYVLRRAVMRGDGSVYRTRIYVVAATGGEPRAVTPENVNAGSPALSPNGRYVAYVTDRQVWVVEVDGRDPRQATDVEKGIDVFKWAPDGRSIAFTAADADTEREKQAKRERGHVERVDTHAGDAQLYVVDAPHIAGGMASPAPVAWAAFHITGFDWSPFGNEVVFSYQRDATAAAAFGNSNIAVTRLIGRGTRGGRRGDRRLPVFGGAEVGPVWSPDGEWIAYTGSGDEPAPIGRGDIYVVPAQGGQPRRLAPTPERSGSSPLGWTADGQAVLIAESDGTSVQVFAVPLDGSPVRAVTNEPGVISSISVAGAADRIAFARATSDTPPDVYVLDLGSGTSTKITDLHVNVPKPDIAPTETIAWTSADGTPIEGLLTYPAGYDAGRRYPLILYLHSGPAGAFTQSFTGGQGPYMLQSLAQAGYAILRPNPRGSIGYGTDFRYAAVDQLGLADLDDVMSGVDRVIELGIAHSDSLAVMGWGYGGYLATAAVARSQRFKAASVGAPLVDLEGLAVATDIDTYLAAYLGGPVWSKRDRYRHHSPIHRLDSVTTPIQIFHGDRDARIPLAQSRALYKGLQHHGVPAEMFVLQETAGAPGRPALAVTVHREVLRWMELHVRNIGAEIRREPPAAIARETSFDRVEYEPYRHPGTASIEGQAFLVMQSGEREYCDRGVVFMNPVTTYSTEWYERNVIARIELKVSTAPTGDFHWITRSDERGHFRFDDLPAGEYYLGCRVLQDQGFAHGRVSVREGETAHVILRRMANR